MMRALSMHTAVYSRLSWSELTRQCLLGALAARQLRCHWLKNPAVRASLFYVHFATQVWPLTQGCYGWVMV
jgi:hypothetical protein